MVTDKHRDRQTPKPDHTEAIKEMSETRASMALVDVWTAIRPWSDPGYTLGVPGDLHSWVADGARRESTVFQPVAV